MLNEHACKMPIKEMLSLFITVRPCDGQCGIISCLTMTHSLSTFILPPHSPSLSPNSSSILPIPPTSLSLCCVWLTYCIELVVVVCFSPGCPAWVLGLGDLSHRQQDGIVDLISTLYHLRREEEMGPYA